MKKLRKRLKRKKRKMKEKNEKKENDYVYRMLLEPRSRNVAGEKFLLDRKSYFSLKVFFVLRL